jgi:hypothetical protein
MLGTVGIMKNKLIIVFYTLGIVGTILVILTAPGKWTGQRIWDAPMWVQWIAIAYLAILVGLLSSSLFGYWKKNKSGVTILLMIIPVSVLVIWTGYRIRFGSWF